MTRYGYARVSSAGQSLDIQIKDLRQAGCDIVRSEKISGRRSDNRPELRTLLDFIRAGDELVVCRLDRLARSTLDLCRVVQELEERGASLRAVHQPLDTSTPTGRLLVQVLAVLAEFETEIRRERQMAGIEEARTAGRYVGRGRSATIDPAAVRQLMTTPGARPSQVARSLNISRASVYRLLRDTAAAPATPPP